MTSGSAAIAAYGSESLGRQPRSHSRSVSSTGTALSVTTSALLARELQRLHQLLAAGQPHLDLDLLRPPGPDHPPPLPAQSQRLRDGLGLPDRCAGASEPLPLAGHGQPRVPCRHIVAEPDFDLEEPPAV